AWTTVPWLRLLGKVTRLEAELFGARLWPGSNALNQPWHMASSSEKASTSQMAFGGQIMIDAKRTTNGPARRMLLWPVAILVSFPIGGLIAELVVDGVDSVGAALAGGLIVGAIIGAAEWFALRQWVSWLWIAATSAGMAVGLVAGAALVDYGIDRGDLALMG